MLKRPTGPAPTITISVEAPLAAIARSVAPLRYVMQFTGKSFFQKAGEAKKRKIISMTKKQWKFFANWLYVMISMPNRSDPRKILPAQIELEGA
jgi:hypothetical protein